jgi:hypothetical protein
MSEEQGRILAEFARRRRRQLIAAAPTLLIVLLLLVIKREPRPQFLGIPADRLVLFALAGVALAVLFSLWNWRCPSCSKYLGKSTNPASCAKCGVKLRQ